MRPYDSDGWPGIELSRPLTDYLSDPDKITHPLYRFLANYIATKTSSLTEVEIARLTTAEINNLISQLPEPEINRILNAGVSELFAGITEQIAPYLAMFFAGCFGLTLLSCFFIYRGWNRRLLSSRHAGHPRHAVIFFTNVAFEEVEHNEEGTSDVSSTGSTVNDPESHP
ncbi:hypothetical protein MtrunA17_Chr5g0412781 [Medicago truncatula]|uniref:Transmembrane protein n=1 Tax=Medicago truncatula TaxID=3880 RepID=A0A396HNP2_MEDTR|nr:uncharacterized protein LOC11409436 [Medicago truncatula]RHN54980.1 hypothetical protein MtrunA17_Chr5g0412781 [Medicago truncatula]